MAFTVQVSHGSDKHQIELSGLSSTVDELKTLLKEATEVPSDSQKIIFKGKTLHDGSKTVGELGMKQGSKVMLLGRKFSPEQEIMMSELNGISKTVDGIEKKMEAISEEVEGIEKGFLQSELVLEACRGLDKRCAACSEMLMQKMEKLDALNIPASEKLVRGKRKSAILRIQGLLGRTDDLAKRLAKCRTANNS